MLEVTYVVDGRFRAIVDTNDINEAREEAMKIWQDANLGGLEVVSHHVSSIIDEEGNFLFEE